MEDQRYEIILVNFFNNLKEGVWQIVCIFSQYIDNISKDNFVDVSQIYQHNIESFRGLNIIKF